MLQLNTLFADERDVGPFQEMIWWVMDIVETLRSYQSEAIVIAQNAAELAVYDDYVVVIDAILQEHVSWIYTESRSYGFVPFVSNRDLNRYLSPVP